MKKKGRTKETYWVSVLGEFFTGMGSIGLLGHNDDLISRLEPGSAAAWSGVNKAFRDTGKDLRWAITHVNQNE